MWFASGAEPGGSGVGWGLPVAQQTVHLTLEVATVATERSDRIQLAILRPARDRLRVDTEHGRDLSRHQQLFGLLSFSRHGALTTLISRV